MSAAGESPLIVGIGPGDAHAIPAAALSAVRDHGGPVVLLGVAAPVGERIAPGATPLDEGAPVPAAALVLAPDPAAHRLAAAHPGARTLPDRTALRARAIGAQVAALATVGAELRRECPWDRRQTPESIVPHTVEEAFEVAEAVASGDVEHLVDELGDLLFQSVFLAQFLEEDGRGDLGTVARGQADKLISRHPHVYGDRVAAEAAEVVEIWDSRKRAERDGQGIFHELPAGLPALAFAAKVQKRAGAVGFRWGAVEPAMAKLQEEIAELGADPGARELGDVLFAAIAVARELEVDAELAVRAAATRFRGRVERAAELAAESEHDFESLDVDGQLEWYGRARREIP